MPVKELMIPLVTLTDELTCMQMDNRNKHVLKYFWSFIAQRKKASGLKSAFSKARSFFPSVVTIYRMRLPFVWTNTFTSINHMIVRHDKTII